MENLIKLSLVAILLVPIAVLGCGDDAVTTPSTFGVVIYERDGWEGEYAVLRESVLDLDKLGGPCDVVIDDVVQDSLPFAFDTGWSNCISSILVPTGWTVILFERDGFEGDYSLPITFDVQDLDNLPSVIDGQEGVLDWDNKATSIVIDRPLN